MWSIPEFHAAINDLPAALFLASVVFDVAALATGRESLRAAGWWTLLGAAGGAVVAVISGFRAEAVIEHGSVMHRSIERHQTLAIIFTVLVIGLVLWRLVHRGQVPPKRPTAYVSVAVLGLVSLLWAAKVGGSIVFDHAAGIDTATLQSALAEREAGHAHEAGTDDHDHAVSTEPADSADTAPAASDESHTAHE